MRQTFRDATIAFTGTQKGLSVAQLTSLHGVLLRMHEQGARRLAHGDCVGADFEAHRIAWRLGWKISLHPPEDAKKRAWVERGDMWDRTRCVAFPTYPYLARNRHIVEESVVLVACPSQGGEKLRSGTWATVRHAAKLRRETFIVWPGGLVDHFPNGWRNP